MELVPHPAGPRVNAIRAQLEPIVPGATRTVCVAVPKGKGTVVQRLGLSLSRDKKRSLNGIQVCAPLQLTHLHPTAMSLWSTATPPYLPSGCTHGLSVSS